MTTKEPETELVPGPVVVVPAPTASTSDGILAMIDRVSSDPEYSIEKMERMMEMYNSSLDRTAKESYMRSMAACQAELPAVVKDAENKQTDSKYATIDSVNRAVVPFITKHGFSLTFGEDASPKEGHMRVTCEIGHRDGWSTKDHHLDVPMDATGIKNNQNKTWTHALGSTATYGRRYLTMMLFNVTLAGDDDDGNVAGGAPVRDVISTETHQRLLDLCAEKSRTTDQVLTLIQTKFGDKPTSVGMMFADQAAFAIARLEAL